MLRALDRAKRRLALLEADMRDNASREVFLLRAEIEGLRKQAGH